MYEIFSEINVINKLYRFYDKKKSPQILLQPCTQNKNINDVSTNVENML